MIDINEVYWRHSFQYGRAYAKITAIDLLNQKVYYDMYRGDTNMYEMSTSLSIKRFMGIYDFKLEFLPKWLK